MTDKSEDDAKISPMQRALQMKKAAQAAKPKAAGASLDPSQSKRMPAGASKPWMKR